MSAISSALQGLNSAQSLLNTTAKRIAADGPSVEDSVNLITARNNFAANAESFRAADHIDKYFIDMYS